MPLHEAGNVRYFTFESLDAHGVPHGVLGRRGGVSPAPWESLNLGGTVGDAPERLTFTVNIDDRRLAGMQPRDDDEDAQGRRRYVTREVQYRLHQQAFRLRVVEAYRRHCAVCRLKHQELLEAAHILPDGHPRGEPIVPNGIALCSLHHRAFDAHILGVTPDYVIEVRPDVLTEIDGPMLIHGIQGFHGQRIQLPTRHGAWPRREFLEERYSMFRRLA